MDLKKLVKTWNNDRYMRQPLILEFCVVLSNHVASNTSLEVGEDLGETLVTQLFQMTQHSGFEEDLGVTNTILILNVQSGKNLLGCDLTVDESSWDSIWSQDGVSEAGYFINNSMR